MLQLASSSSWSRSFQADFNLYVGSAQSPYVTLGFRGHWSALLPSFPSLKTLTTETLRLGCICKKMQMKMPLGKYSCCIVMTCSYITEEAEIRLWWRHTAYDMQQWRSHNKPWLQCTRATMTVTWQLLEAFWPIKHEVYRDHGGWVNGPHETEESRSWQWVALPHVTALNCSCV